MAYINQKDKIALYSKQKFFFYKMKIFIIKWLLNINYAGKQKNWLMMKIIVSNKLKWSKYISGD